MMHLLQLWTSLSYLRFFFFIVGGLQAGAWCANLIPYISVLSFAAKYNHADLKNIDEFAKQVFDVSVHVSSIFS
jgi:hypothetical protein